MNKTTKLNTINHDVLWKVTTYLPLTDSVHLFSTCKDLKDYSSTYFQIKENYNKKLIQQAAFCFEKRYISQLTINQILEPFLTKPSSLGLKPRFQNIHSRLMWAIDNNLDKEVISFLISQGAQKSFMNISADRRLLDCVRDGNVEGVKMALIDGANINVFGNEPLQKAIAGQKVKIVKLLIENGANGKLFAQRLHSSYGSPLHWLLMNCLCIEAKAVVADSTDLEVRDKKHGWTPLHWSVIYPRLLPVVSLLIEKGVNINALDLQNRTPLHIAALYGIQKSGKTLIQAGALLDEQDIDGKTPLHVALESKRIEFARMLIQKGANLEIEDKYKKIPINLLNNLD